MTQLVRFETPGPVTRRTVVRRVWAIRSPIPVAPGYAADTDNGPDDRIDRRGRRCLQLLTLHAHPECRPRETPLAYVSLVPAIALALAAVRARPDAARTGDP